MKRFKLILTIFFITVLIPFIVNAESCDMDKISIDSVTMNEKSDNVVEIDNATINRNIINVNLSMLDVGDSIEYKVLVKNRDNKDYKINNISFDMDNNYIDSSIIDKDGSDIIKANSSKNIYLKIKYANEVSDEDFESRIFNDTQTMTVNLATRKSTPIPTQILDIIKNPNTGEATFLIIILLLLISGLAFILAMKKEYTKFIVLIIGTSIIIPLGVYAICEAQIKINLNIKIDRKPTNVCPKSLANNNGISVGDEISIDTEDFYVLSSDDSETVLLSKYNLYVGERLTARCTSSDCATIDSGYMEISEEDEKYGLQSNLANAFNYIQLPADHSSIYGKSSTTYGSVSFSGTNYWDNSVCQYILDSSRYICDGTRGLLSEYSNSANLEGVTNYASLYPYVYNKELSTKKRSLTSRNGCINYGSGCGSTLFTLNNGYTIAYYVEQYVNRLKDLGLLSTIKGRLLTYEETTSLSNEVKGKQAFWLGSAKGYAQVYIVSFRDIGTASVSSLESRLSYSEMLSLSAGVRPVIVVKTIDIMPSC